MSRHNEGAPSKCANSAEGINPNPYQRHTTMKNSTSVPAVTSSMPNEPHFPAKERADSQWWACPDWCKITHRYGPDIERATGLAVITHEKSIVESDPLSVSLIREDKVTLHGIQSVESYVAFFAEEVTLTVELARDMADYLTMVANHMGEADR
jgi:hypothetical protein